MKIPMYRFLLLALYAVTAGVVLYLLVDGGSYYQTSLIERPRHIDYWRLKPGGSSGVVYGIIGSSMMTLMLVYSMRKRVKLFRRLGGLRLWLDFHIYCGVFGPALVILHSSFKVHGLVALSFWSMIVVALSGFVGRYLYVQFPRARSGDELTLQEVERRSGKISASLQERFHVPPQHIEELDAIAVRWVRPEASLVSTLLMLPVGGLLLRWDLRRFRARFRSLPKSAVRSLSRSLGQRALLQRRIHLWNRLHRLFHYWHVFHKPFSVVMYIFMIIHVAVALSTGYGWTSLQ